MSLFGIIFVIFVFIILLAVANSYSKPPDKNKSIEIDVPHPERCQDKSMLDFIAETPNYKLEPVFKEYVRLKYVVKQLYLDAYYKKLEDGYIYRKDFYKLAGIEEEPSYTWEDSKHERLLALQERRALFTESINFEVTGVHIPARKNFIRNHCTKDDEVELVPEPKNKYDENAVKVRCNDRLIGYIPAEDALDAKEIIKKAHYAYISRLWDDYGHITVYITVEH